jgi:hypothetical protein
MASQLKISPSAVQFSVNQPSEVLRTPVEGGLSRYRREVIGSRAIVDCLWEGLSSASYDYMWAFYRAETLNGSLPFSIELELTSELELFENVYFVHGSFKLSGIQGDTYSMSAQLIVDPLGS